MFELVYIEFWMLHFGYGMVYFVFWMFHLVLLTENLICLVIFYFKGWILGDWDDVIGILDAQLFQMTVYGK